MKLRFQFAGKLPLTMTNQIVYASESQSTAEFAAVYDIIDKIIQTYFHEIGVNDFNKFVLHKVPRCALENKEFKAEFETARHGFLAPNKKTVP